MMNFKEHVKGSALTAITVSALVILLGVKVGTSEIAILSLSIILGGNFPDIDTNSYPSKIYAWVGVIATIGLFVSQSYGGIPFIWIPFVAAKMFGHRKWTHSIILPLLTGLIPVVQLIISFKRNDHIDLIISNKGIPAVALMGFTIGVLVHLFLDSKIMKRVKRN